MALWKKYTLDSFIILYKILTLNVLEVCINTKEETKEILEENMGKFFHNFSVRESFLTMIFKSSVIVKQKQMTEQTT